MEPVELEPSTGIEPKADNRDRMDELPPVRLTAVADVRLHSFVGIDDRMDDFYVGLWQFRREPSSDGLIYRAENVCLRFEIVPARPVDHESLRPQGIEVESLTEAERKLIEVEWEYVHQVGLTPGQDSLLLQDPAGNWIEIIESRRVG